MSAQAKPFLVGLTGSIGMGKSTTAAMFADLGFALWDADAAVHRLYGPGGAAVAPIQAICPDAIRDTAVDRAALKTWIASDKTALARIEKIVHPLVAKDREKFIAAQGSATVILDIPLLFETGGNTKVDFVVVVSAPYDIQRARVLERPGMTQAQFDLILSKQMPDAEKCAMADFVIETVELDAAKSAVKACVSEINKRRRQRCGKSY